MKLKGFTSDRLRLFIIISIALHVGAVAFLLTSWVVSAMVQRNSKVEEPDLVAVSKKAEEIKTKRMAETTREAVKEQIEDVLKKDAAALVDNDLSTNEFEKAWSNVVSAISSNVDVALDKLAIDNYQVSPEEMTQMLADLRNQELEALQNEVGDATKDEIAAQILDQIRESAPDFNRKVLDQMETVEGAKAKEALEKFLAAEQKKRTGEFQAADGQLARAEQEIEKAAKNGAGMESALKGTMSEMDKRKAAVAKADAALAEASAKLEDARQNAQVLMKPSPAGAKPLETAAAVRAEAAREQAALQQALADVETSFKKIGEHAASAMELAQIKSLRKSAGAVLKLQSEGTKVAAALVCSNYTATASGSEAMMPQMAAMENGLKEMGAALKAAPVNKEAGKTPTREAAIAELASTAARLGDALKSAGNLANAARNLAAVEAQAGMEKNIASAEAALKKLSTGMSKLSTEAFSKAVQEASSAVEGVSGDARKIAASLSDRDAATAGAVAEGMVPKMAGVETAVGTARDQLKASKESGSDRKKARKDGLASLSEASGQLEAVRGAAEAVARNSRQQLTNTTHALDTALGRAQEVLEAGSKDAQVQADPKTQGTMATASAGAKAVASGPVKQLTEAMTMTIKDPRAIAGSAGKTDAALASLEDKITTARRDLAAYAAVTAPTDNPALTVARNAATAANQALEKAGENLEGAAEKTGSGTPGDVAGKIQATHKKLQAAASSATAGGAGIKDVAPSTGAVETSHAKAAGLADILASALTEIGTERKALATAGTAYSAEISNVVNTIVSDKALGDKARASAKSALREKVAEDLKGKAESLASRALSKRGLSEDSAFVKDVGQLAVQALLGGTEGAIDKSAYASLAKVTSDAFDVKTDGKAKESNAGGIGGSATEGASDLEKGAAGKFTAAMQAGAANAVMTGSSALKLPTLAALSGEGEGGAEGKMSLNARLKAARGRDMRSLVTGDNGTLLASLSQGISEAGRSGGNGGGGGRRYKSNGAWLKGSAGGREDWDLYKKNIEGVIAGREVDQVVLTAPSLNSSVSSAQAELSTNRVSMILIPRGGSTGTNKVATAASRKLVQPAFKSFAFGGAPMATKPLELDGDMAKWGPIKDFILKGQKDSDFARQAIPAKWDDNRNLMVQWSREGFYFTYTVVDDVDDNREGVSRFWQNDSVELWFDFDNKREETRTEETPQFWFWPLGSAMAGVIGGESVVTPASPGKSPSLDAYPRFRSDGGPNQPKMVTKRVANPKGYQVEIFLPAGVFRKPQLTPGRVIAFEFSINTGVTGTSFLWTTGMGKASWATPSIWGDLMLLGSDGDVQLVKPGSDKPLESIIPGEPIGVRVTDIDMNFDSRKKDRVRVGFAAAHGDEVTGYLEETDVNTGVFAGSIDTMDYLQDIEEKQDGRLLQVMGGETVKISYLDQFQKYGERNTAVTKALPVGLPVLRMSAVTP